MQGLNSEPVSTGMYLRLLRTRKKLSLRGVVEHIGISENYMSEIERDVKSPSDDIIVRIAKFYNVNEIDLFERFNRVPVLVTNEILDNKNLNETLYQISNDKNLSPLRKQELYRDFKTLYLKYVREGNRE